MEMQHVGVSAQPLFSMERTLAKFLKLLQLGV